VANKAKVLKWEGRGPETAAAEVLQWRAKRRPRRVADQLATEEPLEIRVRGRSVAVTMRTPGHDAELAAGFLLTEGLIRTCGDVLEIAPWQRGAAPENSLNVFLAPAVEVDFERLTRHVFATSSCGLCGKASIDAVHQHVPPVESQICIEGSRLFELPKRLRAGQKTFNQTGGLHAAAVFDARGKLVVVREDVGRHTAVDKIIGYGFWRNNLQLNRHARMLMVGAWFKIIRRVREARFQFC